MARHDDAYWDKRTDQIAKQAVDKFWLHQRKDWDRKINLAIHKALQRYEKGWDNKVNEAIERAIGVYSEDLKDKMDQVLESTDFIIQELAKKPDREEFDDLKTDVKTMTYALKSTNEDLHKLEAAVYNA